MVGKIQPLVSVIIPVYNVENYLVKCVESVLQQTEDNIQVILIDDCSTDKSRQVCMDLAKKDKRIEVLVHNANMGVSVARNSGLVVAKGKYVYFVDADDYLESNAIEEMSALFQQEVDLVVCGHYVNDIPLLKESDFTEVWTACEMAIYVEGGGRYKFKGYLWNKLFKNEIIKKYSIQFDRDLSICEDSLFCHEYLRKCKKVIYASKSLYHYVIREGSAIHSKINQRRMTILDAYQKITDCCKLYENDTLNKIIQANYWSINIGLLKKIILNYSNDQIEYGNIICEILKGKEIKIFTNHYVNNKRRFLALIVRPIFKIKVLMHKVRGIK